MTPTANFICRLWTQRLTTKQNISVKCRLRRAMRLWLASLTSPSPVDYVLRFSFQFVKVKFNSLSVAFLLNDWQMGGYRGGGGRWLVTPFPEREKIRRTFTVSYKYIIVPLKGIVPTRFVLLALLVIFIQYIYFTKQNLYDYFSEPFSSWNNSFTKAIHTLLIMST